MRWHVAELTMLSGRRITSADFSRMAGRIVPMPTVNPSEIQRQEFEWGSRLGRPLANSWSAEADNLYPYSRQRY